MAKVARLTNDGRAVGPGSYDIKGTINTSPRTVDYRSDKTRRPEIFVKSQTQKQVGPGSYHASNLIDRSIKNPTIPRAGWGLKIKKRRNNGSIKADFEEDSEDEGPRPGPGDYLSER